MTRLTIPKQSVTDKRKVTEKIPKRVKPFVDLGLEVTGYSGDETNAYAVCPFCGKEGKFSVSTETQKWQCLAGGCGKTGNLISFIREWYEEHLAVNTTSQEAYDRRYALAEDRGIPLEVIEGHGVIWDTDGQRYVLPIRDQAGKLVSVRFYRLAGKLMNLTTVSPRLWGIGALMDPARKGWPVYHCEGEWDAMALELMRFEANVKAVITASPGTNVFSDEWVPLYHGRDVISCYDNDAAGRDGTVKVLHKVGKGARTFQSVNWPLELPSGFDVRDLRKLGKGFEELQSFVGAFEDRVTEKDETDETETVAVEFPPLSSGERPTFETTLAVFRKHLFMSPDLCSALRVIYAVVISNQIEGDPLWVHIVSPPGGGKTQLLMSLSEYPLAAVESNMTAHTLVSGFKLPSGEDPSLLPQLIGPPKMTFVLKDYTEVLGTNAQAKEEIFGTLRGAYDGTIKRTFGNGIMRRYTGHFSMVSGVTPIIFRERGASLGERFLLFYMPNEGDADNLILAAMANVGKERGIMAELTRASNAFLSWRIDESDIPEVPEEYKLRIVSLAYVISMLRAVVEKDRSYGGNDRLHYRPTQEVPTRPAKQLQKLLLGLALQNTPPQVTEDDFNIVMRAAVNSCIGWNVELVNHLAEHDGFSLQELIEATDIPRTTLREYIDSMTMLGILTRTRHSNPHPLGGGPLYRYHLSERLRAHWLRAELRFTGKELPKVRSYKIDARGSRKTRKTPVGVSLVSPVVRPNGRGSPGVKAQGSVTKENGAIGVFSQRIPAKPKTWLPEDRTPDPGAGGSVYETQPNWPFAGTKANGTNPKALGTNPRAMGTNPKALGTNPRALGTNPKAFSIRKKP